jgi:hypothetical protein
MSRRRLLPLLLPALILAACGSSGGGVKQPTIGKARTFGLSGFTPAAAVAGTAATVGFTVEKPTGGAMTPADYKRGSGPHTGVHLIIVRDDLSTIVHLHPPIPASGRLAIAVDLPRAGRYHVLVDVYPASGPLPNFQLHHELQVGTGDVKAALPPYDPVVHAGGLTFRIAKLPGLRLAEPASMIVNVTDAAGKPVAFTPFYGALAHAIFFRAGTLDYFHSHICGNDPACTAGFGSPVAAGHSTKPGQLELGVLLASTGKWRLFLQVFHGGKLITAPFTLRVR